MDVEKGRAGTRMMPRTCPLRKGHIGAGGRFWEGRTKRLALRVGSCLKDN